MKVGCFGCGAWFSSAQVGACRVCVELYCGECMKGHACEVPAKSSRRRTHVGEPETFELPREASALAEFLEMQDKGW